MALQADESATIVRMPVGTALRTMRHMTVNSVVSISILLSRCAQAAGAGCSSRLLTLLIAGWDVRCLPPVAFYGRRHGQIFSARHGATN